jgi:ABC-type molybdate transport system ATPase subunit
MSLHLQQVRLPLLAFTLEIDATFDFPIVGIFGPSGAGKTSLLELIAGLLPLPLEEDSVCPQGAPRRLRSSAPRICGE